MSAPAAETPEIGLDEDRVRRTCGTPFTTWARAARATAWLKQQGAVIVPAEVPEQRGRGDWVVASVHTPDAERRVLGDVTSLEPPPWARRRPSPRIHRGAGA